MTTLTGAWKTVVVAGVVFAKYAFLLRVRI